MPAWPGVMRTAISGACSSQPLLKTGDFLVVRGEGRTARYTRRFFLGSVGLFGLDPLPEILLIAVPTACLWRTDRRAKPWQCPKCRYDLRGLDGGVWRECGASVESC